MTVTPLATRGKLLQAGAVVINESAAWQCVGGFSRGTKVIELNVRIRGEKCEDSENTATLEVSVLVVLVDGMKRNMAAKNFVLLP